jgi:hypothetical protein
MTMVDRETIIDSDGVEDDIRKLSLTTKPKLCTTNNHFVSSNIEGTKDSSRSANFTNIEDAMGFLSSMMGSMDSSNSDVQASNLMTGYGLPVSLNNLRTAGYNISDEDLEKYISLYLSLNVSKSHTNTNSELSSKQVKHESCKYFCCPSSREGINLSVPANKKISTESSAKIPGSRIFCGGLSEVAEGVVDTACCLPSLCCSSFQLFKSKHNKEENFSINSEPAKGSGPPVYDIR